MSAIIPYDHLMFVEGKHFLASNVATVEEGQSGNLTITFDSNHNMTITDVAEIQKFKDQYTTFLTKNGIYIWEPFSQVSP